MLRIPLPGVFKPRSDSRMLADQIRRERLVAGARVLDVCTGSGVLAIAAARAGASRVTAVDVSWRAVIAAWLNARLNGVRLRVRRGDLLEPVRGERFDLIVSNPPYIPSEGDALPRRGPTRSRRRTEREILPRSHLLLRRAISDSGRRGASGALLDLLRANDDRCVAPRWPGGNGGVSQVWSARAGGQPARFDAACPWTARKRSDREDRDRPRRFTPRQRSARTIGLRAPGLLGKLLAPAHQL